MFEKTAYDMSLKIFITPVHTCATLFDDVYWNRAKFNKVKSLSSRKADREGHSGDAITDALFRVMLEVRFRSRGETKAANVEKLVEI